MTTIRGYTVEDQPIGSGGMGRVLKGYAPDGCVVAIKEIYPEFVNNALYRQRIDNEIRFLKKLDNPSIVKIYDDFEENDRLYIVMEYVDGEDLEHYVGHRGALSVKETSNLMLQLLNALQYVHEQDVVHRDIKPANIIVRSDGRICLIDFGIAKDTSVPVEKEMTIMGTVLGTDGYMSPEQATGMSINYLSDIYALGCVMFYMLTGRHAVVHTDDKKAMFNTIVFQPVPRISEFRTDVPDIMQQIVDRATHKNMTKRFQSCISLADAINNASSTRMLVYSAERDPHTRLLGGQNANVTPIQTPNVPKQVKVSVGRENCDIIVALDCIKVSRHHLDVTMTTTPDGPVYTITDCSTNGTLVDYRVLSRGESCQVKANARPTILISTDPVVALNWNRVCDFINRKAMCPVSYHNTHGIFPHLQQQSNVSPSAPLGPTINEPPQKGFLKKVKSIFSKS